MFKAVGLQLGDIATEVLDQGATEERVALSRAFPVSRTPASARQQSPAAQPLSNQ